MFLDGLLRWVLLSMLNKNISGGGKRWKEEAASPSQVPEQTWRECIG